MRWINYECQGFWAVGWLFRVAIRVRSPSRPGPRRWSLRHAGQKACRFGVSRHNRGGACRLFKVKVSETEPKITPDQASLSPSGVIQPASQQFPSPVNDSGRHAPQTRAADRQDKNPENPPLISVGHTSTGPFVLCNTHARRHDQAASLWCTKQKDAAD